MKQNNSCKIACLNQQGSGHQLKKIMTNKHHLMAQMIRVKLNLSSWRFKQVHHRGTGYQKSMFLNIMFNSLRSLDNQPTLGLILFIKSSMSINIKLKDDDLHSQATLRHFVYLKIIVHECQTEGEARFNKTIELSRITLSFHFL